MMLPPMFDDIALCKHVTAKENAFIIFNSFSYMNKLVILVINIVIDQLVILMTSSPSGTGFM